MDVLNPELRKQRIELLEQRTKLYQKVHEAGNLNAQKKKDYLVDLRKSESLKRIDRSEDDVLYFMYEYFSDNRQKIPPGILPEVSIRLKKFINRTKLPVHGL